MSKKPIESLEDLNELFVLKKQLTELIDSYVQLKVDLKLKNYYSQLSMQLADQIICEIDKSTSKIVERFEKEK